MASVSQDERNPSRRDVFEGSISGAQDRPFIPRLRSDPTFNGRLEPSLEAFRQAEGRELRKKRLLSLWKKLPHNGNAEGHDISQSPLGSIPVKEHDSLDRDRAEKLARMYEDELMSRCQGTGDAGPSQAVTWTEFKNYAFAKESELWRVFHDELDLDGNGHLDAEELSIALGKAGIKLTPSTLSDFMTFLTSSPHSHAISFPEFRDFLLLLPRKASTSEIYRYYEVRKYMGDDGRGAARVTMEGDVSLSAEDKPPPPIRPIIKPHTHAARPLLPPPLVDHPPGNEPEDDDDDFEDYDEEEEEEPHRNTSFNFLLAGGIAGVVSRTSTAPFDRLKVFLITRAPEMSEVNLSNPAEASKAATQGAKALLSALRAIYMESGLLGFWVGNGLNVAKIFPESAIKFFSYESSKTFFATYVDKVDDTRNISASSRFISGGFGGITSQLSIYPVETLKTQLMSTTGETKREFIPTCKRLWALGGLRAYYRGLTIGLIGVFPYAAIDMSTFEALKLAYLRSSGKEEPGVFHTLIFGSVSGSIGATSVYPLNLVRTRLQASGSSGHPQRYTGMRDVVQRTWAHEGIKGFYRGLLPTLAKVIPSVSISYVVYEQAKKKLGVQT
ncbi:mitochondrial carrier [Schizopora paradoxa]|uniref:Mitochondrial carrier n=1 Tax=Schizopora paradoxa TaxID=27342 RepID=A0A0H2S8Q8_9AGAM|nr:mitochondrial carrier [Schizopora paradoxa]